MQIRLSALLILIAAHSACAGWVERESRLQASVVPGLNYQHLIVEDPEGGGRAVLDFARFTSGSCRLRLIDNRGCDQNLGEALETGKCLSGVNGGYFDPNFAPLGLRIAEGRRIAPLSRGRLLTGILISSENFTKIVRVGEFSKKQTVSMALECGPFLVDGGRPVSGLDAARHARRTFVALGRNNETALGVCSEVTLAELSEILVAGLDGLKVQRALNLDGGSSSAFWFKRKDANPVSIPEEKIVRDFVGVVAR